MAEFLRETELLYLELSNLHSQLKHTNQVKSLKGKMMFLHKRIQNLKDYLNKERDLIPQATLEKNSKTLEELERFTMRIEQLPKHSVQVQDDQPSVRVHFLDGIETPTFKEEKKRSVWYCVAIVLVVLVVSGFILS